MESNGKAVWYVIGGVVVAALIVLLIYSFDQVKAQKSMDSSVGSSQTQGTKLIDEPYFSKAYLISSDTLDTAAQNAISGFSLSKTALADGSVNITLKALNSEYTDRSYTVQPGQSLYFIEMSGGDDSPPNGERYINDDSAVIVDSNGYVVS